MEFPSMKCSPLFLLSPASVFLIALNLFLALPSGAHAASPEPISSADAWAEGIVASLAAGRVDEAMDQMRDYDGAPDSTSIETLRGSVKPIISSSGANFGYDLMEKRELGQSVVTYVYFLPFAEYEWFIIIRLHRVDETWYFRDFRMIDDFHDIKNYLF
jgi:hypothetical protein